MVGFVIYLICLVVQIYLAFDVFKREDVGMAGKVVMVLVIILVPYMLGAAFYYFYGRYHLTDWFK